MSTVDWTAIDRMLAVAHDPESEDQACSCDECMAYGAEDAGFDWYRLSPVRRIALRLLDGDDARLAPLRDAINENIAEARESADLMSSDHKHGPECLDCVALSRATVMAFAVEAGLATGPDDVDDVVRGVVAHLAAGVPA